MSWIEGYNPVWVEEKKQALELVEAFEKVWIGKTIEASYVGWYTPDNEWDENLPVVLIIGGRQYEVCWQKFDSLAITSDQIDVRGCICSGEHTPYKKNVLPALRSSLGKEIERVSLGMSSMTFGSTVLPMINSVDFKLKNGFLTIFNALDENGLSDEPANV